MKKAGLLLMALAAMGLSFTACGGGDDSGSTTDMEEATEEVAEEAAGVVEETAGEVEETAGEVEETAGEVQEAAEQLVDMANHVCPVCGMHAHGGDFAAHDGKKINVCSADCAESFKSDPEKFMAKLEEAGGE